MSAKAVSIFLQHVTLSPTENGESDISLNRHYYNFENCFRLKTARARQYQITNIRPAEQSPWARLKRRSRQCCLKVIFGGAVRSEETSGIEMELICAQVPNEQQRQATLQP